MSFVRTFNSVAGFCLGLMCGYLLSRYQSRRRLPPTSKSEDQIFEVIFFPSSSVHQETSRIERISAYRSILQSCPSLQRMASFLSQAKSSLDICMFVISCQELGTIVLQAIQRGVKVRLLCDYDSEVNIGSQVKRFREARAFVRTKRQDYIMHHKFVVIDRKIIMTGSFNWTMAAAMGNRENVIVTNHVETVDKFLAEFEKLWEEYAP